MLAFFSLVVSPDGTYTHSKGSLFQIPPELCDKHRIQQYLTNSTDGWTTSELGYLLFQKTTNSGFRYIFPGLYLTDGPKPSKKFVGYKANLSKADVEIYVTSHLDRNEGLRVQAEQELTALVHDLRHLSSAIYHSTEQSQRAFQSSDKGELADGLKTIVATQTMLKARIDYLDYVSGVDRFEADSDIPVFSRVDKVVRCFKAVAKNKKVTLRLKGQSFRYTRGPNILDIVPYTIIDNAIKYSPSNFEVGISVYDTDEKTFVSIESVGPSIKDDEKEKIFDRGTRGKNAAKFRSTGTGLGLAVASEIVSLFDGEIMVECTGETQLIEGVPHQNVMFRFAVPTFGEDIRRMTQYQVGRNRRKRRGLT